MAPAAQNLMAARSGRGLFRTGSSARGLPTSPLSRSGSLPHLSWAFAKGKSKVHPDDEAKDGDDDVGLLRMHLGSSLNVRLEKWHERTERHKRKTVEGWILRQQGLLTMLFTFFVFTPAWAIVFNKIEGWAAWDAYIYVFTVITTIGYGNFSPAKPAGMYATIFMGLTGIPLMCYALAWIGTASQRCSHLILKKIRKSLGFKAKPSKMQEIYFSVFLFMAHFAHCVIVFCVMEAWTITTSCYYTFVTLSTIGLGDEIALYYKPGGRPAKWRCLTEEAVAPYADADFYWQRSGVRPELRRRRLEKFGWYHFWYVLAVFCGLAVVSQLFTLIVQWIHCIDDSFDREFSHMAGKVRQLAKHGRAASKNIAKHVPHMRCRHRDRSRDDHRHEKMMEKSKMVEPASDLLVLLRIRRQLLAAAYVAGGDDWYHVLKKIDANGDGKITRDELATWIRSVLPAAQAADKYINALFDLADHDQSGDLSVEELAWLLDSVQDHHHDHHAPHAAAPPAANSP